MTRKILHVDQDTIAEVIFEIRFQGNDETIADLLPGILFAGLKDRSPKPLPIAALPREMQTAVEGLRYKPRQGLEMAPFRILMSDYSTLVSNSRPYVGWTMYKQAIVDVLGHLQHSGLIKSIERCSLKYVNVIQTTGAFKEQFSHIKLDMALGQRDLTQSLTTVRTELHEQDMLTIVEVAPSIKVNLPTRLTLEGLMISVDTINTSVANFWANQEIILERTHDVEKSIFFDILTKETLTALGPVYE